MASGRKYKGVYHKCIAVLQHETNVLLSTVVYHMDRIKGFAELHFMATAEETRRKGIGSYLIQWWQRYIAKKGLAYAFCYADDSAIGFYHKNGWSNVEDNKLFDVSLLNRKMHRCTRAELFGINLQEYSQQPVPVSKLHARILQFKEPLEKFDNKLPVKITHDKKTHSRLLYKLDEKRNMILLNR